jgi:hypothetical protein
MKPPDLLTIRAANVPLKPFFCLYEASKTLTEETQGSGEQVLTNHQHLHFAKMSDPMKMNCLYTLEWRTVKRNEQVVLHDRPLQMVS